MLSDALVLLKPGIDDDLGLLGGAKPFGIKSLAPQFAFETFVVAVLPMRSSVDLDWLDPHLSQPVLQCRRDKL